MRTREKRVKVQLFLRLRLGSINQNLAGKLVRPVPSTIDGILWYGCIFSEGLSKEGKLEIR